VDRSETDAVKQWLPIDAIVSSLFIDTAESFPDHLINDDFTHIIHTGSSLSITKVAAFTNKAVNYIQKAREKGIWQMGICYGHQLICLSLIGREAVQTSPNGLEAGWVDLTFVNSSITILGVRRDETVWQHHFDEVTQLPLGSEILATNKHTKIQAYINYKHRLFGIQFHPEFNKELGDKILLDDKELQETSDYNIVDMMKMGPSFETGKVFFGFFLRMTT